MGAYFVLYPQSRVLTAIFVVFFFDLVEIPAIFFLGIWFLMQLLNGVGSLGVSNAAGGGTAFWAHVGGFVVGAAVRLRAARAQPSAQWAQVHCSLLLGSSARARMSRETFASAIIIRSNSSWYSAGVMSWRRCFRSSTSDLQRRRASAAA